MLTRDWEANKAKATGALRLLHKLLTKRFGTLPDWVDQQLRQASFEELLCWCVNIFDAVNIEDFFYRSGCIKLTGHSEQPESEQRS